jgi:hypothetical protein
MKKIILFIILFFGILPLMHKGKLSLINTDAVYADTYAQEDCDPSDPNGDCYCDPSDPSGDCYCDPSDPNGDCYDPCKDGYSDNYASTTSLSGNITTTIKTWDNYDGCDNYLGQGTDDPGVDCGISDASISVSPNSGNYGDAVLLTAHANIVGSTALHYEIQQSSDGGNSWDDVGNDSGSSSFSYKIDEYGENDFRVIVSCDCSISVTSTSQSFMAAPNCNISGVTMSVLPTTGSVYDDVDLTANVSSSGNPTLTYEFQELSDAGWVDIMPPGSSPTLSYHVDMPGSIQFKVIVTAQCGNDATQITSSATFMAQDVNTATITLSPTTGPLLTDILLTGSASAQANWELKYKFQKFDNGSWITLQEGTNPNYTYTIDEVVDTRYKVLVKTVDYDDDWVESSEGTFHTDNSNACTYTAVSINWLSGIYSTATGSSSVTDLTMFTKSTTFDVCPDFANGVWRLTVTGINGNATLAIATAGSTDPSTNPPTTEADADAAIIDMQGYLARGGRGLWQTVAATKAHEEYHYSELKCASEHYWPDLQQCFYNNFKVPFTSYTDKESAKAALLALNPYAKLNEMNFDAHAYAVRMGDGPNDPPLQRGQEVLNQAIIAVQALATTNHWTVTSGTTTVNVPAPCSIGYTDIITCPTNNP